MSLKATIKHTVMVLCGGGYIQPNVSLCDDNDKVYYNVNSNGYEYVDLELPSGTLWATQNVGADKPSDYGLYFQWGDTSGYTAEQVGIGEGQKKFARDWSDYKWRLSGDSNNNVAFTKYTTTGATLELEDDAAHVNMGGAWHMPTPTQIQELIDSTTTAWTTSNGVSGMTFTSKKDTSKYVFFPAAGYFWGAWLHDSNKGRYWSSMLNTSVDIYRVQRLDFNSIDASLALDNRLVGRTVRGVIG